MQNMVMPLDLSDEVEKIRNDRHRGARELTISALRSLRILVEQFNAGMGEDLIDYMLSSAKAFAQARPSMVSILNSIAAVVYDVLKQGCHGGRVKESILSSIDEQLDRFEKAFRNVISFASKLPTGGSTVSTCSYSSTVIQALIEARKGGKSFRVIALRSRSTSEPIEYGSLMCRALNEADVQTQLVDEKEVGDIDEFIDMAIVGADTIFPDGSFLNGYPTLLLAKEMSKRRKPFYVVSETWKIDPLSMLGYRPAVELGMDKVPADLVTAFMTELGSVESKGVSVHAQKLLMRLRTISNRWTVV